MYSLGIVEIYVVLNAEPQLQQTDIIFDFDIFVFQRPPETLRFCIIAAASAPVHADLNSIFLQFIDELITGLLAALVGIKDFRLSKAFYRHSQRFHTVKRLHSIDHIICHQFAAEPVCDSVPFYTLSSCLVSGENCAFASAAKKLFFFVQSC